MRPARGFTLVEVTVVIGIIVLLAGLTLSASNAIVRYGEQITTTTVLTQLDAAVSEWELQADRKLSWGEPPLLLSELVDVHALTPEVLIITEILDVVTRNAAVRDLIAQVDPILVYRYEDDTAPWLTGNAKSDVNRRFLGSVTILDAWGTPIYATHPGSLWTPPGQSNPSPGEPDPDGTIQTYNEKQYGIAPNRRVVFVSAGPDRRFGLLAEFPPQALEAMQEAMREARLDNIYSIPVTFIQPGMY